MLPAALHHTETRRAVETTPARTQRSKLAEQTVPRIHKGTSICGAGTTNKQGCISCAVLLAAG